GAPLEDIAVHVKQPEAVRPVRAHLARAAQFRPLGGSAVGVVAGEVGLPGGERFAWLTYVERFGGSSAASACVLPLRFRRQPIGSTFLLLLLPRRQFLQKLLCLFPRHVLDRKVIGVHPSHLRLASAWRTPGIVPAAIPLAVLAEETGVISHDSLELFLRH